MKLVLLALVVAACTGDDRHYPVIPSTAPNAVGEGSIGGADAGVRDADQLGHDAKMLPKTDAQVRPDAMRPTDALTLPDAQL
jgi:hypothetical protein